MRRDLKGHRFRPTKHRFKLTTIDAGQQRVNDDWPHLPYWTAEYRADVTYSQVTYLPSYRGPHRRPFRVSLIWFPGDPELEPWQYQFRVTVHTQVGPMEWADLDDHDDLHQAIERRAIAAFKRANADLFRESDD